MSDKGFTLFDTTIGPCGIGWGRRGITGVELPETAESQTRERLRRRFQHLPETAPPPDVQYVLHAIAALLYGKTSDLSKIELDMTGVPPFNRRVYEIARTIPSGTTLTYDEIAARLGETTAARAVGQALGRNPFAIIVPCHRVLAAGGKLGGFSAHDGTKLKRRLLAIEGALIDAPTLFD
jgi:methylated-DNA-[protein]-cysteine S-methyltransferase